MAATRTPRHDAAGLVLAASLLFAGCQQPAAEPSPSPYVTGLRSAIYPVDELDRARAWYSEALGIDPYFDEPFYVGFDIDGFEIGLDPDTTQTKPGADGVVAYWQVNDIRVSYDHLLSIGATQVTDIDNAGGLEFARVGDPFGNVIGLIEMATEEQQ